MSIVASEPPESAGSSVSLCSSGSPATSRHIELKPDCGICGKPMEDSDPFVALLGKDNSTAYLHRTDIYSYPDQGVYHYVDNLYLCRRQGCRLCSLEDETVTLHADCFRVVLQESDDLDKQLDHLWTTTAWKTPWRWTPRLHLAPLAVTPDPSTAEALGLRHLKLLPAELTHIIQNLSADSPFWRYSAAKYLVRRMASASEDELVSAPLGRISTWSRGCSPTMTDDLSTSPFIRLTIDSDGIRKIERLHTIPSFQHWRTDRLVYATLDLRSIRELNITAQFKFGLARLEISNSFPELQLWDTPTPPKLEDCFLFSTNIIPSRQFHTIDLRRVTGITFFYCLGEIYAIHAHTHQEPNATTAHRRLSARHQNSVAWVYMPIAADDSIIAWAAHSTRSDKTFQKCTSLVFRFKLAGDVSIGIRYPRHIENSVVFNGSPSIIVHEITESLPIAVIGSFSPDDPCTPVSPPLRTPIVDTLPFSNACFSQASLNGVTSIRVFLNTKNTFCQGVLLGYSNGSKRTLGQCRLGEDPSTLYINPTHICTSERKYSTRMVAWPLLGTTVQCSNDEHEHDEGDWDCHLLAGDMIFWFSDRQSKLMTQDTESASI